MTHFFTLPKWNSSLRVDVIWIQSWWLRTFYKDEVWDKMGGELVRLLPGHLTLQQKQRPWRIPLKTDQLKSKLERPFKKHYSKQHLAFPVLVYFCIPCPLTLSVLLYIYFHLLFLLLYSFVHSATFSSIFVHCPLFCLPSQVMNSYLI